VNYRIVLFLHLAGAVATFVGVGVSFLAALTVRRVRRTEEIKSLALIYEMGAALALVGVAVVAASGLGMALTVWGLGVGWVQVAIGAFALMAPVGPLVVGPRIELLIEAARGLEDGPLPPALMARVNDPLPKFGLLVVMGDLAGIVFIMTVKPSLTASILAVVAFVALGAVLALPAVGRVVSGAVDALARLERSNPLYRR
jgi:predicted integral membrane protein DUF2269